MKHIFIFFSSLAFCFTFLLTSCNSKDKGAAGLPANILNEQELTRLLITFSLAESAANMNIKNVPLYRTDTVYAFNPLTEYGIRLSQYDSTIAFYIRHPELYKKVYESVLAELTRMHTQRDSLEAVIDRK